MASATSRSTPGMRTSIRAWRKYAPRVWPRSTAMSTDMSEGSATFLAVAATPSAPVLDGHRVVRYFSSSTGRYVPPRYERGGERIEINGRAAIAVNESTAQLTALLTGLGVAQTFAFMAQPYASRAGRWWSCWPTGNRRRCPCRLPTRPAGTRAPSCAPLSTGLWRCLRRTVPHAGGERTRSSTGRVAWHPRHHSAAGVMDTPPLYKQICRSFAAIDAMRAARNAASC